MDMALIKMLIAGGLFTWLVITKKKKTKKILFWVLMAYLLFLGVKG